MINPTTPRRFPYPPEYKYAPDAKKRRFRTWSMTQGRCVYCGAHVTLDEMQVDHLFPKCQGGKGSRDNLAPSCGPCNNSKNGRSVEEYRRYIERKLNDWPYFSPTQLAWLEEQGFIFPEAEPYLFWFEINCDGGE
ncbi:MAG: HNH endonuclease [Hyphomicrobiaceae bacterium]|nr:MAG: HNH endonuclease [Hyphomicrobiaceae bacterium]